MSMTCTYTSPKNGYAHSWTRFHVVLLMRRKSQGLPGTKGDDSGSGPKNG